jgi:hypothetical protein
MCSMYLLDEGGAPSRAPVPLGPSSWPLRPPRMGGIGEKETNRQPPADADDRQQTTLILSSFILSRPSALVLRRIVNL